ncbi:MAG: T9SS type A sorting domain-containing protein [Bacteroidota bacterium]
MRKIVIVILLLNYIQLFAQSNRVLNPSFELYNDSTPVGLQAFMLNKVTYWSDPNNQSSDLYCPNSFMGYTTPPSSNQFGHFLYPKSGRCYAGGIAYSSPVSSREFIQGSLIDSLIYNHKYAIKYFISIANGSRCFTDLGFLFTNNKLDLHASDLDLEKPNYSPQYENASNNWLNSFNSWQEVRGVFNSNGNEMYVSIGNFCIDTLFNSYQCTDSLISPENGAYYFIDDIAIYDTSIIDTIRICMNDSVEINHQWYKPGPGIINEAFDSGLVVRHYIEALSTSASYTEIDIPYHIGDTVQVGFLWVCHSTVSQTPIFVCDSFAGIIGCWRFRYLWPTPDTFVDAYFQNIYGCDSTVRYHVRTNVGIDNVSSLHTIIIYPNPAKDYIQIEYDKNKTFYYTLFDITGKEINTKKLLTPSIDISHLEKGLYILEIKDEAGNSIRKKIVKE